METEIDQFHKKAAELILMARLRKFEGQPLTDGVREQIVKEIMDLIIRPADYEVTDFITADKPTL